MVKSRSLAVAKKLHDAPNCISDVREK